MKWDSGNERPIPPSAGFPNVVRYERCDYVPQGQPQGRSRISDTLYATSPPTFVEIHSPRTVSSDMYKVINRPPADVDGKPNFRGSPIRSFWPIGPEIPYVHGYRTYYTFADQEPPRDGKDSSNPKRSFDNSSKMADSPPKEYETPYSPAFTEEVRRSEYVKSVGNPYNPGLMKSYVESYNQGFVHLNGYTQDDADRIFGKDMTPNPHYVMYTPHYKGPVYHGYNPPRLINRTVSSSTSDLRRKSAIKRHSILKPEAHPSSHALKRRCESPSITTRNIFNLSTAESSPQESPMPSYSQSPPYPPYQTREEDNLSRSDRECQTNTSFLLKNFLKREQREREREEISPHRKIVNLGRAEGSDKEKKKKHFLRKAVANDNSSTIVYDSRKQRTEENRLVRQSLKDQETETNQLETFAKSIQTSATNLNKQYRTRSTSIGTKKAYNERGKSPVVIHILEIKDDEDKESKEPEDEQYRKPPGEVVKRSTSLMSLGALQDDEKTSKHKKRDRRSKSKSLKRKCSRESIREVRSSKKGSPARSEGKCGSKHSPYTDFKGTKSSIIENRRKIFWKRTSEDEIRVDKELTDEKECTDVEKRPKEKKKRKASSDDCGSPCKEKTKSGTASPKERHVSVAAQRLSLKPKTYDKRSMYRCGTLRPEPETPHNWQCYMMHKQELDEERMPEEARTAKKTGRQKPVPGDIPAGVENELRHLKSQLFHLRKEWAHFSGIPAAGSHQKIRGKRKPIQIDPADDWIVM